MGRPRKQQDGTPSTVAARRANEDQRQAYADELRSAIMKETEDARKATTKRLNDKGEDSRTLVDPDPRAAITLGSASVSAKSNG